MGDSTEKTLPKPEGAPVDASTLTFFCPNYSPDLSFAMFPLSGQVTITYGPGSPSPTNVFISHQGGGSTPVAPGQQTYAVNAGDYLLIEGQGASCKIQWFYN
jgi:hypothetical protein